MNLLEYYIEKNKDKQWYDNFVSVAKDKHGKLFTYTNTNYRTTLSFIKNFQTFLAIENKPREKWQKSAHGQETHKQHTVNMVESRLFTKHEGYFERSSKGLAYTQFIDKEFPTNEKWLINFVFLSDSYFDKRINYPLVRSQEFLTKMAAILGASAIQDMVENFVLMGGLKCTMEDIMHTDFFYIHSLYDDYEFLSMYKIASDSDKRALQDYVVDNYVNEKYSCCISEKYRPSGRYNQKMIQDDAKVVLFSNKLALLRDADFQNMFSRLIDYYSGLIECDPSIIRGFIFNNSDVFEAIYINISGIEELEDYREEQVIEVSPTIIKDIPKLKVDDTNYKGKQRIIKEYIALKSIAKEAEQYKCALEKIHQCSYFTSKKTNKNYLEIHHLIPREFRNDFDSSIEVLANYIPLCPRCHRLVHNATDRERTPAIHYLSDARSKRLEHSGVPVELEEIYRYYKLDA